MSDYRCILVAYDFSAHSEAALETALELSTRLGSRLCLVHVIQPPVHSFGAGVAPGAAFGSTVPPTVDLAGLRESAEETLRTVGEQAASRLGAQVETHVVEGGSIVDRVRETAEALAADLIVMGTHGRTGIAHVFLGSVAERTMRRSPCPVLTVPIEGDDPETSKPGAHGGSGAESPGRP